MWCSLLPWRAYFCDYLSGSQICLFFIRVTKSRFIHLLHAHQLQVWMPDLDLPQWSETRTKMHRSVRIFSHGADGHLREEEAARKQWWERGTGGGMPASTDCFLCRATWVAGFRQWHRPPSLPAAPKNQSPLICGRFGTRGPLHTNKQRCNSQKLQTKIKRQSNLNCFKYVRISKKKGFLSMHVRRVSKINPHLCIKN